MKLLFVNSDRNLRPILSALLMGLAVCLSLLWTQKGIHVSGVFSMICPVSALATKSTEEASFCSPRRSPEAFEMTDARSFSTSILATPNERSSNSVILKDSQNAADRSWLIWMVSGIFFGGLLSSLFHLRSFRFSIERGVQIQPRTRLILASVGGCIVGAGAALAGGCTSSIGLTGAALLSVGAFCFLGVFFVGGFAARILWGRIWSE